jgi:RecA/RadA recombinase
MAKTVAKPKDTGFNLGKVSSVIENLSKKSMITIDNLKSERKYISTGIYILNALLSKSILHGGIPTNRFTIFAGPYQTGKSYICLNTIRNAQKDGYSIIYIDTEFAIETPDFDMFGIDTSDPNKFVLIRSNKVENLKVFLAQLLDELKKLKEKGEDVSKTIFIIDSLGALASRKEIEDAIKGNDKQDMSRAKATKSMLRIIIDDLGYLGIPLLATNHTYLTQDLFPQTVQTGGEGLNYLASIIILLSKAKLEDKERDELSTGATGSIITAMARKNRLAKPKKVKFEIDHSKGCNAYKGLEFFCTPENFEKVGIAKVKPVVDKKTGEITYDLGSKWYIKHLDKTLFDSQIYNGKVFTKDVLEALEPIIYEYFRYASYEEYQTEMEALDEQYAEFEQDVDFEIDGEEADIDEKLFG